MSYPKEELGQEKYLWEEWWQLIQPHSLPHPLSSKSTARTLTVLLPLASAERIFCEDEASLAIIHGQIIRDRRQECFCKTSSWLTEFEGRKRAMISSLFCAKDVVNSVNKIQWGAATSEVCQYCLRKYCEFPIPAFPKLSFPDQQRKYSDMSQEVPSYPVVLRATCTIRICPIDQSSLFPLPRVLS